jgi:hypothetical protein
MIQVGPNRNNMVKIVAVVAIPKNKFVVSVRTTWVNSCLSLSKADDLEEPRAKPSFFR